MDRTSPLVLEQGPPGGGPGGIIVIVKPADSNLAPHFTGITQRSSVQVLPEL
jgi:hypothetical protein